MKKNIVIEISKNSNIKYEYNSEKKRLFIDRVLYGKEIYPQNYGFFENTLDWDGDPLDGLVIANDSFLPGSECTVRILGTMEMIDGGETDTKIISVFDGDPRLEHIKEMSDIPEFTLKEIKNFFLNYKILQKKEVKINRFGKIKDAEHTLKECENLYSKYNKLEKNKFINKMKKENPKKYLK